MLRKVLKAIGWTAAGLVALVVVLYLGALAINWRDRDPSPAAVRLTQVSHGRPAVADESNGYVFVQRWKLDANPRRKLSARVEEFLAKCGPGHPECAAAFDSAADGLSADWTAADAALLDSYMALAASSGWREDDAFTMDSLPVYSGASDGQKMLLLRARKLAKQGDAAGVRGLLERDLQFWRMVLQSSDILISKMVASSVLNRHFEWGNLVLRSLPAASQAAAIPAGWRSEISADERSMQRCIAGEWLFASRQLRRAEADSFGVDQDLAMARISVWLARPMYQPQDTTNQYAEYYASVARAFEVPLNEYPRVVRETQERAQQTAADLFPYGPVYNLPGGWLLGLSLASNDMTSYVVRVGDVEGVRRAALAAAMLRASGVEPKDVTAALTNVEQRDPYTNRPFEWDEASQAIVFRGLQSGERGEHRIYY